MQFIHSEKRVRKRNTHSFSFSSTRISLSRSRIRSQREDTVSHKDFSDVCEKMSGKRESAGEAHLLLAPRD